MFRFLLACMTLFFGMQTAIAVEKSLIDNDEDVPDAMQHMAKAPEIDFVNLRDPFASYLTLVSQRNQLTLHEQNNRLDDRPREVLEDFDLSTLKIVGIFTMGEKRVAMVEDVSGKGYVVHRGNYIGKNGGRIEKIDNTTLYLVQQAVNPAGEVVDQQISLTLEEVNE
ncbi:MAG: pilus assembly protein PilP [Mariprofundaceae bacterium]